MRILYKTCEHQYHWYAATNEDGWKCWMCEHKPGEPPGFAPALDRSEIRMKVFGILHDLHDAGIIYISNSSQGDSLEYHIANRCRMEERFDSYSIALFILEAMTDSHAAFWKKISEGVLSGNDPRKRCDCGKLAIASSYGGGKEPRHACAEHWSLDA